MGIADHIVACWQGSVLYRVAKDLFLFTAFDGSGEHKEI